MIFPSTNMNSKMEIPNLKTAFIILINHWDKFAKVGDFFYPKVNKFAFLSREKWELDESAGSSQESKSKEASDRLETEGSRHFISSFGNETVDTTHFLLREHWHRAFFFFFFFIHSGKYLSPSNFHFVQISEENIKMREKERRHEDCVRGLIRKVTFIKKILIFIMIKCVQYITINLK